MFHMHFDLSALFFTFFLKEKSVLNCSVPDNHRDFFEFLKTNTEILQILRGRVPHIDVELAKRRLFLKMIRNGSVGVIIRVKNNPDKR